MPITGVPRQVNAPITFTINTSLRSNMSLALALLPAVTLFVPRGPCAAHLLLAMSHLGSGVRPRFFFFFSIEWVERRGRPFYIACTGPMARLRVGVCFSRACVPGRAAGHDVGPKQKKKKRMER